MSQKKCNYNNWKKRQMEIMGNNGKKMRQYDVKKNDGNNEQNMKKIIMKRKGTMLLGKSHAPNINSIVTKYDEKIAETTVSFKMIGNNSAVVISCAQQVKYKSRRQLCKLMLEWLIFSFLKCT